ncbi:MAG TPA: 2-hydroxychromene-2-carboxylate isomerase [Steroidobacteraceae bacterium]|nr:2-hydroxychromene-2-carboxylate isomerase [Steroidobacteraceae bacterium]
MNPTTPASVTWYFDFISPYSYLAQQTLRQLPPGTPLQREPVLFAGMLNHWGQKGPAEIAPKRQWTYRSCLWLARKYGVPLRMPAAHPFNSLPYLRLAIAAGRSATAIETIFAALWTTGADPADPQLLAGLTRTLHVEAAKLADPAVKNALREATQRAVEQGVFGVPSLVVRGQVFWGADSVDFAAAYLEDPAILENDEMRRADTLPVGAARAV